MGDQQSMFLFLAAFYAVECLLWLPRGSTAFTRFFGTCFRRLAPGEFLGNHRGAMVLRPLLPIGTVHQAMPIPMALSPDGIVLSPAEFVNPGEVIHASGQFIPWSEVASVVAEGKHVSINRVRRWSAPSPTIALAMVAELNAILAAPEEQRAREIEEWIRKGFDLSALRERFESVRRDSRWLGILGLLLFFFVNCLLLPLSGLFTFSDLWLWIIGAALCQTSIITILYWRTHKKLYPESGDERFTSGLTMLLFAPAAMRAKDLITAPALVRYHPLAIAALLLRKESAKSYAAFLLREHQWAPAPRADERTAELISWHRGRVAGAIEDFCRTQDWSPDELLLAPARTDPESRSYCPRCLSEYLKDSGNCAPCGQVALKAFPAER